MSEILTIEEIITSEAKHIDMELRYYQKQIDNQGDYYDWQKPNIEIAQKNIDILQKERTLLVEKIVESTKSTIADLSSRFGEDYMVIYSKQHRYIEIHRENCVGHKHPVEKSDSQYKKCKTYQSATKIAHSLIQDIQTDIDTGCSQCKPYWNLPSIKSGL